MRVLHGIALAALLAAVPAAARDLPLSTVASFGPAPSTGIGARSFGTGRTFAVDALWHPERASGWVLRAGYIDLARDVTAAQTNLLLDNGGQLYVPKLPDDQVGVDVSFLQVGLRQSRAVGRVRPFVEAAVGASVVRDAESRVQGAVVNDRRTSWDASPPRSAGYESAIAPSFGLGVGAVSALPGRIALVTSIGAEFTSLHGLVGAQLPVRFGASWPAAMPATLAAGGERSPRFRAAAGLSALHASGRISGGLGGGHSFSGEVELPVNDRLALSLAGEHDTRETRETVWRQQMTNFGTTEMVPAGSVEAAFAATIATLGARVRQPIGRAAFSLRTGFGSAARAASAPRSSRSRAPTSTRTGSGSPRSISPRSAAAQRPPAGRGPSRPAPSCGSRAGCAPSRRPVSPRSSCVTTTCARRPSAWEWRCTSRARRLGIDRRDGPTVAAVVSSPVPAPPLLTRAGSAR